MTQHHVWLMQEDFEATNATVYEVEKRMEERLTEVRTDVSLATAECRQGALSEALRSSKLQLDSLQDRLTLRIQGILHFHMFTSLCLA